MKGNDSSCERWLFAGSMYEGLPWRSDTGLPIIPSNSDLLFGRAAAVVGRN